MYTPKLPLTEVIALLEIEARGIDYSSTFFYNTFQGFKKAVEKEIALAEKLNIEKNSDVER